MIFVIILEIICSFGRDFTVVMLSDTNDHRLDEIP
jgi:hypothetical protein